MCFHQKNTQKTKKQTNKTERERKEQENGNYVR